MSTNSPDRPLEYPGTPHHGSGLLVAGRFVPMPAAAISETLRAHDHAPMSSRVPVLGVGANASPRRLASKLSRHGTPTVVPMIEATVHNLAVGVGAFVSRAGYLPATPIVAPDEVTTVSLSWLTTTQLRAVDATERNYHRVRVPAEAFPVIGPSGQTTPDPHLYASCRGNLARVDGPAIRLTDQHTLLKSVLADSPEIQSWMGGSPESFVANSADAVRRERVAVQWWLEGRISRQPELEALPGFRGVHTASDGRPLAPARPD